LKNSPTEKFLREAAVAGKEFEDVIRGYGNKKRKDNNVYFCF